MAHPGPLPLESPLRTFILCEKNMKESVAMLPQVRKINCWFECDRCAWVSKYTYSGFFSTQYEITRLARIRLCRLVGIHLNRFGSDTWVNTECKAVFAVASFHNTYSEFVKPAWCSNSSKLSAVVSTYRSTSPVVRFVHEERSPLKN